MVVEGTADQITATIKALELQDTLPAVDTSSTHGTIPISDMQTSHIRNALLNRMGTYVHDLHTLSDLHVVNEIRDFPIKLLYDLSILDLE